METEKIAIQDTYDEKFQHCFGCGAKNEHGLHLHSYPGEDGETCICKFLPDNKFTGGVPNNLYGGMIAMIFDCHGTASAAYFAHKNKGYELTKSTVIGRFITARLEIDFKKPVQIDGEITVISAPEELSERKAIVAMKMEVNGIICAEARMVAVRVKDDM